MVAIKSTVVFISVAINLLVQAAPVYNEQGQGGISHLSTSDGLQFEKDPVEESTDDAMSKFNTLLILILFII